MRRTAIIIFAIVTLYYLTLLVFGPASLARRLVKDSNSTFDKYRWTNKIVVVGNVDIISVSQMFNQKGLNVQVIDAGSYDEMNQYISGEDIYHYILLINSNYLPLITVEETENINEYVAEWEKKYFWCFGVWIQLDDKMTGIS